MNVYYKPDALSRTLYTEINSYHNLVSRYPAPVTDEQTAN